MANKGSRALAASVLSLLGACGDAGGACPGELAEGSYLMQLDRRSGNCTSYAETVIVYDGTGLAGGDGCVVEYDEVDECGASWRETCPYDGPSGIGEITTTTDIDFDASGGAHGLMTLSLETSDGSCGSTYDVSITAL
jgi:hypothetical protein